MFKIYVPSTRNSVDYYVRVIKMSIESIGEPVEWVDNVDTISKEDIVVTIEPIDAYRAWKKKPKKLIFWFQGVIPEQVKYYSKRNKIVVWGATLWCNIIEWYMLKKSDFNFFVSKAMLNHYRRKYGYKGDNYLIMPCFNTKLETSAFTDEKYAKPKFLYSGNSLGWQCFPEIVKLYKQIKETIIPDAELLVLSNDHINMEAELRKQGVEAEVKYVPYTQFADEVKDVKYGFLVRHDNAVNNVATPTKMSSYLGNGIIPIFSNVIGDFKEELSDLKYAIPLGPKYEGLEKLKEIESKTISGESVLEDFKIIFSQYYNTDYYIKIIGEQFKSML